MSLVHTGCVRLSDPFTRVTIPPELLPAQPGAATIARARVAAGAVVHNASSAPVRVRLPTPHSPQSFVKLLRPARCSNGARLRKVTLVAHISRPAARSTPPLRVRAAGLEKVRGAGVGADRWGEDTTVIRPGSPRGSSPAHVQAGSRLGWRWRSALTPPPVPQVVDAVVCGALEVPPGASVEHELAPADIRDPALWPAPAHPWIFDALIFDP